MNPPPHQIKLTGPLQIQHGNKYSQIMGMVTGGGEEEMSRHPLKITYSLFSFPIETLTK